MASIKARTGKKTPHKRVQTDGQQADKQGKPVALTFELDGGTYVRLSTLIVTKRRTHQLVMREAVEQYCDSARV